MLGAYHLGAKLRELRLRKKVALVELGRHTGLSPSMLSQLENGKLIPTLPTLARIAMVFDVGLEYFFGAQRGKKMFALVRAADRMRFPENADTPDPAYFFECLTYASPGTGMQAYLADFPKREPGKAPQHSHPGTEFVFLLQGRLAIGFQGEEHVLETGDSVHLDSSAPHTYRALTKGGAKGIVVTLDPKP